MSNLWIPTKQDRKALNSGDMKIKLRHYNNDGLTEEVDCPFCEKQVLKFRDGYLTLTGSQHKCKGMGIS